MKTAGQLLWNRVRTDTIPSKGSLKVYTGLCQKSLAFGTQPDLASRTMIIPMVPLANWADITHGEPSMENGEVVVTFYNPGLVSRVVNVLFWAPHTYVGPGEADVYNPR